MALRAMPNLRVIRPADANETVEAWRVAMDANRRPDGARAHPPEAASIDRSRKGRRRA